MIGYRVDLCVCIVCMSLFDEVIGRYIARAPRTMYRGMRLLNRSNTELKICQEMSSGDYSHPRNEGEGGYVALLG